MSHGQAFHCRGRCRDPAPWRGEVGRVVGSLWELWALSRWHSWAIKRSEQFITVLRASQGPGSTHLPLVLFRAEAQFSLPFVTTITDELCKAPWILSSYPIMPPSLAFSPQLQSMVQRDGYNSSLNDTDTEFEVKVTESWKSPQIYKDFPKGLLTPNSLYFTRI